MKALTVRQPWAWAIVRGHKTIENRSWTTADKPYSLTGRIVAVVDLVGICTTARCECGPWAMPGQAHWRLANANPVDGPKVRGRPGLWDLDVEAGQP